MIIYIICVLVYIVPVFSNESFIYFNVQSIIMFVYSLWGSIPLTNSLFSFSNAGHDGSGRRCKLIHFTPLGAGLSTLSLLFAKYQEP